MPLSANFQADFSSFLGAVAKAETSLKSFESGASKVESQLNRVSDSLSGVKIVQQATLAAEAVERIGGVSKLTDAELKRIGATATEAAQKLTRMGQDVPPGIQKIADAAKNIKPQMDAAKGGVDSMLSSVSNVAGAFGIAFGTAAVVGGVKRLIGDALEMAGAIDDTSKKLGVSAEKLQGWNAAANLSGATADDVSSAIGKMNANLDGGSKSTVDALKAAGLQFSAIRAMKPEDAFETISTAIMKIEDPMTRARVAMELFGKGGQTLLPAIMADLVKVGAAADKMSDDTVAALDAAGDAWTAFGNKVTIVTGEMLAAVMGTDALTLAVKKLSEERRASILERMPKGSSIEDYQKALIAAAKAMQDVSLANEKAAPAIRQTSEELAAQKKAAEDAARAVQKLADIYTGKALARDIQEQALAMERANKQGGIMAEQAEKIAAQLQAWAIAGGKLEPIQRNFLEHLNRTRVLVPQTNGSLDQMLDVLDKLRPGTDRLIAPLNNVTLGTKGLLDVLKQFKAEMGTPPWVTYGPSLEQLNATARETKQSLSQLLSDLSRTFAELSQASGGAFGDLAADIAKLISAASAASRAGEGLRDAVNSDDWAAAAVAVMGFVAALDAATASGSKAQQVLGGAMTGAAFGQSVGSLFGPTGGAYGALIGAGGGALVGALRDSKDAMEAFEKYASQFTVADKFGVIRSGSNELRAELFALGKTGEDLWKKLYGAATQGDMGRVQGLINEVNALLREQAAAQTAAAQAAKNAADEAAKAAQEQLQDDEDLLKAMERYKFTIEELGPAFQRQQLNKQAAQLMNDFRLLVGAGGDVNKVIERMGPDLNKFIQQSVKMGQEVPIELQGIVREMIKMGVLFDENGNKIESLEGSGISFSQTMTQGFDRIVDKLNELLKGIGLLPDAADRAAGEIDRSMNRPTQAFREAADEADRLYQIMRAMGSLPSVPGQDTPGGPWLPAPTAVLSPAARAGGGGFVSVNTPLMINTQLTVGGRTFGRAASKYTILDLLKGGV